MTKSILTVKNLAKRYGEHTIFENINLTVNEGDTIVIIGPSGTGKSTFLRCLNLLTKPNGGQIWLDDQEITAKDVDEDQVRQHIGMVFKTFALQSSDRVGKCQIRADSRQAHVQRRC